MSVCESDRQGLTMFSRSWACDLSVLFAQFIIIIISSYIILLLLLLLSLLISVILLQVISLLLSLLLLLLLILGPASGGGSSGRGRRGTAARAASLVEEGISLRDFPFTGRGRDSPEEQLRAPLDFNYTRIEYICTQYR